MLDNEISLRCVRRSESNSYSIHLDNKISLGGINVSKDTRMYSNGDIYLRCVRRSESNS
jgi:hypothetical protein